MATAGADVISNLFSDFSPLIALFGDDLAKQFLSTSYTWLDYIIFAMAPLGILPTLWSAIRVSGPQWLKSLIGRAREDSSAAEVELTSATSDEVCELYNGQAIVRTTGNPRMVKQLIYVQEWLNNDKFGFADPEKDLVKVQKPKGKTDHEQQDGELIKVVEENAAPNISLNLYGIYGKNNIVETACLAFFGVILQAGVLVFSGIVAYSPSWNMKLQGPMPSVGFPLQAAGTIIVSLSMMLCSFVIVTTTDEKRLMVRGYKDVKSQPVHLLWLQKKGVVGDQRLGSYLLMAREKKYEIFTSRKSDLVARYSKRPKLYQNALEISPQVFTVLAVVFGLIGFITQFEGFHLSNWSAAVAQLVAMAIMTGIRAMARRGLNESPEKNPLPENHELDWLALKIVKDPYFLEELSVNKKEQDAGEQSYVENKTKPPRDWKVKTPDHGCSNLALRLKAEPERNMNEIVIRKRLRQLTGWEGAASKEAEILTKAIEVVMNKLLPLQFQKSFTWRLNVIIEDTKNPQEIEFSCEKLDRTRWTADKGAIEAALSLWKYGVSKESYKRCYRVLGPKTEALQQDLAWWISDILAQESLTSYQEQIDALWIGFNGLERREKQNDGHLAVDTSLNLAFANHMFSAFIWAIAPEVPEKQFYPAVVDPLSFDVNDYKTWNSLRLQNAQLMNLATEIQSTGLGSLREIYLGIIPPLSCAKRLQSDAVVEHVLQKVLAYETSCRWGMAFRAYLQLLDMCEKGCSAYMFVRKAVDATIEFLLQVAADPPAEDKDPLDSGGMDLENIKRTLVHKLKGPALRNVTAELKISYVRQGRIEEYEKLFHNITSDSKGAKRVSENRVLRLRGPDTVGWRPHHLILTQKDKDWEDHQRAKQIASKVNHDIDIAGRSFLHYAVMKNRPILARALLQTANFNLRGRDGRTPLHWAAILGYRNMTNLLLEKRTVKDGKDNAGRTALHLAAWAGHRDIVELLLERNVNKNDVDNAARTALHFASWKGELDVVQLLLERKADKDAVDELGRTALHFTAWAGQQNIVDFLLKKNLEIDASDNAGRTALHLAVWANHRDTVNQLLEKNAKRNRKDKYGWTPLSLAARNGDMDMVQQLLDANVNVEALDHMGMTAWDLASVAGHRKDWDLMMLLETKKIKQHKQEYTVRPDGPPQRSSSQDVENDVVKQPLEMSARVDDLPCAERTVLHSAALAGDQDRVEQLLSEKHNISIDARDQEGRTALHLAAWKGYHGIVELLLENEARKDVKDVENRRPIHLAAWAGYPIVVNLLLLDLKTDKGMPLWIKIKDDERDREIEIREENRLMLNPKDKYGWTPLSIAAGNGRVAVVELLIKFGADLFSNDNSAKTALLLADENVRSLLLRHGALLDAKDTIRPDKPSDRRVPQFDSETLPQDLQYAAESSASLPPPPFPGPNPEFKKGKPVPKVDSLLLKDSGSLRALAEG